MIVTHYKSKNVTVKLTVEEAKQITRMLRLSWITAVSRTDIPPHFKRLTQELIHELEK